MCRVISTLLFLTIIAACGGGGAGSPFDEAQPTSGPPGPVSNITATGTDGGIIVDWFGALTATSYNVYWSESPGVTERTGTKVTVDLPPAIITGLNNGITYYAIVTAENDEGESGRSDEVQAVAMLQPPPVVTGVKADPGDGEATIEWADQPEADSYSVFRGTSPSGGGVEIADATSPFVVTGLTNSETYYLSVTGNNAAGQGTPSQALEVTPIAAVLGWTVQTEINTPFAGRGNSLQLNDVAINDSGVAAAVWTALEGSFGSLQRIVVNHTASGDWDEQVILSNAGSSAAITVTPAGDVHVASDEGALIRARRYTDGDWTESVVIRDNPSVADSFGVDIAADGQGNVFLCWVEDTIPAGSNGLESTQALWVARFDATTAAWGEPQLLSQSPSWMRSPALTTDSGNAAIVSWLQDSVAHDQNVANPPDRRVVYASRYDGAAWQPAEVVGRNDLTNQDNGDELALDANAAGSAVVLWTQTRSATGTPDAFQVEAVLYDASQGQWLAPDNVVDDTTQAFVPNVVMSGANGAAAAWTGGPDTVVSGSTFDPATSLWGAITDVPTDILGAGEPYAIDGDEAGSIVVAWAKDFQVPKGVFVRRLEAGSSSWGDTDHLGGRVGNELLFAMSRSGHAILVTKALVVQSERFNNVVYGMTYSP